MSENKGEKRRFSIGKPDFRRFRRLVRFLWPQRRKFIIGLVFLLGSTLASLSFPAIAGKLVDAAGQGREMIDRYALLLLGVFFLTAVFSYFRIWLFGIVTHRSLVYLRKTVFQHILQLPIRYFQEHRAGELGSRIAADISLLQDTFTTTLAQFIRQSITIIGGVVLLLMISFKLTVFMLALVPVLALLAAIFGRYIRTLSRNAQSGIADSNTVVEEVLQGINSVKAYANEHIELLRFGKRVEKAADISIRGAKWRGLFASFIVLAMFGSISLVLWYGVRMVDAGAGISAGDLFTFVLYTVFIGGAVAGIADLYAQLQKAVGATENLLDILEEKTEMELEHLEGQQIELEGRIEFRNVTFAYPSRPDVNVLRDISFTIKPGEKVALVGPSGAGKSTLTQLLFRFFDPTEGEIIMDEDPLKNYEIRRLRSALALVPQEVLLFGGTIEENIAYGKPSAVSEEIHAAAKLANALEFIQGFPEGMNTLVGDRGVQLSGGQRQRIAIARAFLRDPSILVLDEATSNLDAESERLLQLGLHKLIEGRTALVIAHRLSTVRRMDRILVLENGSITEEGSHEELIRKKEGLYRKMWNLQARDGILDPSYT